MWNPGPREPTIKDVKILLVDDHRVLRDSVSGFLAQEPFCSAVVAVGTAAEAKTILAKGGTDVLLCDLSLAGDHGLALIEWSQVHHPDTACLCLTMHGELSMLRQALAVGARGFVTKSTGYEELRQGIITVADGGMYLDQTMLTKVLHRFTGSPGTESGSRDPLAVLTEREREVFYLLLEDLSPGEVAENLNISTKTVENHRSSIFRKLDVHDRLSLFRFAQERSITA